MVGEVLIDLVRDRHSEMLREALQQEVLGLATEVDVTRSCLQGAAGDCRLLAACCHMQHKPQVMETECTSGAF